MIWTVLAITVGVVLITLYEWPKINQNQKKEKAAFVTLTAMGWLLSILLLYFPDMPGPTQMIEKLFKPLGKLLEK
ncbi:hypothetical protein AB7942_28300 [Neobacillus sp. BF23-41]|uniref:hypothetical protein n=1 Tax=Neobacillus sp. BF23-41 TaxID=3240280 RepID=UPI0034E5E226